MPDPDASPPGVLPSATPALDALAHASSVPLSPEAERLLDAPIQTLAASVASGTVSALGIARAACARVVARNPGLGAIVNFQPDRVLAEAARVDARVARGETLPLAGVPFTVKDNLWVEGYRITQGSRLFEGFVAPRDAWAVARLREAGAVMLGVTHCPEFACKGVTDSPLYGLTRHPLDPARSPGGSSGGAAAATAAGLGHFALGTDAGGSVRRPAALCGLVGHKPSPGLVPHPWGFAEPGYGLSVVGVLTRSVADCRVVSEWLAAWDAGDPSALPLAIDLGLAEASAAQARAQQARRPWRIAWSPQVGCPWWPIDSEVLSQLQRCVDALTRAGWAVQRVDPPWPDDWRDYPLQATTHAGLYQLYGGRLAGERDRFDPQLVEFIEAGAGWSPQALGAIVRKREQLTSLLGRWLQDYDLWLTPTVPVTAWPHDEVPTQIGGVPVGPRGHAVYTQPFNLAGLPGCSVPAGRVRGWPVGLHVSAARYEDARVLAMCEVIEETLQAEQAE